MEGEEGVMTPGFCPGHPGGCFAFGGEMIDAYCVGGFEEAVPPMHPGCISPYTCSSSPAEFFRGSCGQTALPRAFSSR